MKISNERKLRDIQIEFSNTFPYLKLEFYSKPHEAGEGSSNDDLLNVNKTIGEVRTKGNAEDLEIDGSSNVKTLEQKFFELFGLNVQIFRKSGGLWLQTTATDNWSVNDQNRSGETFSRPFEEA